MEQYYIALIPEKKLIQKVDSQKQIVMNTLGNQKYLTHPPHFTLIIFTTEDINQVSLELEKTVKNISKFKIRINDFHIFYDDVLTGKNTITYSLPDEDIDFLKKFQLMIVDSIDSLNSKQFISKDSDSYAKMSEIEKSNTDKYGFPFVAENWIPHITLASIDKDQFDIVFTKIKESPIMGEFTIESINLYRVGEETSFLIKEFELK